MYQAVPMAVRWGLAPRDLSGIGSIGTDEIALRKGHSCITLVYPIDEHCKRLLRIGKEHPRQYSGILRRVRDREKPRVLLHRLRQERPVREGHGPESSASPAYPRPLPHHGSHRNGHRRDPKRRGQNSQIAGKTATSVQGPGDFLKRPENLTDKQETRPKELLFHNLKAVRATLLKEDFQSFRESVSPTWAENFLKRWITRVLRPRLKPMKRGSLMLRSHPPLIRGGVRAREQISSGTVEGFNTKAKLTARKS